jgi:hypothetical protein
MSFFRAGICIRHLVTFLAILAFSAISGAGDRQGPGIRIDLKREGHLSLHITLRSGAHAAVKLLHAQLPWSGGDSLIVVAAIANGQCLRRDMPVDHPVFHEISVEPDTPLYGDVDLESLFPDIRRVSRVLDVQLFWAYDAPEALHIGRWSGGWILISKQK